MIAVKRIPRAGSRLRAAGLIVTAFALAVTPTVSGIEGREIAARLEMPDGLFLEGVLVTPPDFGDDERAPAVLLLHSVGGNREDLELVVNRLVERRILALAMDLRGHGHSRVTKDHKLVAFPYLAPRDMRATVADQKLILDWLAARPEVDPSRIGLAAVGFGGLIGATAAGGDERVAALAIVCPTDPYLGISAEGGIEKLGERPVWLATTSAKPGWVDTARRLAVIAAGNEPELPLHLYEKPAARTVELIEHEPLVVDLVDWLAARLGATAP